MRDRKYCILCYMTNFKCICNLKLILELKMWCNHPSDFNIAESECSKLMKREVRLRFVKILYFARLPSFHLFQLCSVCTGMYL